jgi:hypothetical protein
VTRLTVVFLALLPLLAVACGGSHTNVVHVTPNQWKGVLDDYVADGLVDRPHSCAAVQVAITHVYSDLNPSRGIERTLRGAEARYCSG